MVDFLQIFTYIYCCSSTKFLVKASNYTVFNNSAEITVNLICRLISVFQAQMSCRMDLNSSKGLAILTLIVCQSEIVSTMIACFATNKFFTHLCSAITFCLMARRMFLTQIKNILLLCKQILLVVYLLASLTCRFGYLRNWQTKIIKLQSLMLDKQCWPVSPGL